MGAPGIAEPCLLLPTRVLLCWAHGPGQPVPLLLWNTQLDSEQPQSDLRTSLHVIISWREGSPRVHQAPGLFPPPAFAGEGYPGMSQTMDTEDPRVARARPSTGKKGLSGTSGHVAEHETKMPTVLGASGNAPGTTAELRLPDCVLSV